MLDLMKSGKAWRNMIGQIAWAKCCKLGEICKAHSFGFWLVSLHLRNRRLLSSWTGRAPFMWRSYDLLQGRKGGESKRQSSFYQFLKHLQLIWYAKEPYFGLSCPESHQEKDIWLWQVLDVVMQDGGALPIVVKLLFWRGRRQETASPFLILLNLCTSLEP